MNKRIFTISAVIIVFLLIVPLSTSQNVRSSFKDVFSPLLKILYTNSNRVRNFAIVVANIKNLPKENDQLSSEVTRLLVENSNLKEVVHENELLKNELNLSRSETKRKLVGARIISRSAFVFQDVVTVDIGKKNGIKVGLPVTSSGALIGRVINVGNNSADVELITSSNAVTQIQLQNSRTTAILRGGIRGLIVEFVPQDITVVEGESILTSGLGGNLRPGLVVGTVDRVLSQKNEVFQRVSVKPAANISRADIVFVETDE